MPSISTLEFGMKRNKLCTNGWVTSTNVKPISAHDVTGAGSNYPNLPRFTPCYIKIYDVIYILQGLSQLPYIPIKFNMKNPLKWE